MFRLIFLLSLISFVNYYVVVCQSIDHSIIIYCDDTPFLVPEIENILKRLKVADNQHLYFSKVTNLTRLRENLYDDNTMDEFITSQVNKVAIDDPIYLSIRSEIIDQFNKHDLFLKVNIHKLGELLEFQFVLYETVSFQKFVNEDPDFIFRLTRNLENPKANYSIFINPKNNYISLLRETIKSIFPQTNLRPIGEIRIEGKRGFNDPRFNDWDFIHWDVNDTLRFSAVNSYDTDSPSSSMTYEWKLYSIELDSNSIPIVNYKNSKSISSEIDSEYIFDTIGMYLLELVVSDGISESIPKKVIVYLSEAPLLYFSKTHKVIFYNQQSLFDEIRYNNEPRFLDYLKLKYSFLPVNNKNWKLIIKRESPSDPNDEQKKIWDLYEKEKNNQLIHEKYANVLKVKSLQKKEEELTAEVIFAPYDKIKTLSRYLFSTQIDMNGVLSNKDFFEYEFVSSSLYRANFDFFSLSGNFDSRYLLVSDSVELSTEGLIKNRRNSLILNNVSLSLFLHENISVRFGVPLYSTPIYVYNSIDLTTENGGKISNLPFFDKYKPRFFFGIDFHVMQDFRFGWTFSYDNLILTLRDIELLDYHYSLASAIIAPNGDRIIENLNDINCVCDRTNNLNYHLFSMNLNLRPLKSPLITLNLGIVIGYMDLLEDNSANYSVGFNAGLRYSIYED